MSLEIDGYNDVQSHAVRRARKEHTCDACHVKILPGELYHYDFWVYDGSSSQAKRCARCELLYCVIDAAQTDPGFCTDPELNCGHSWEDNFGEPPPDHIAALAFLTREEAQERLAYKLKLEAP